MTPRRGLPEFIKPCLYDHPGVPTCDLQRYYEAISIAWGQLIEDEDTIHSEFCSASHHIRCDELTKALAKIEALGGGR